MPETSSSRFTPRGSRGGSSSQSGKPAIRPKHSFHLYRGLHGPRIRRYHCVGDPIRDRDAETNLLRIFLVIGLIGGAIFLIMMFMKR